MKAIWKWLKRLIFGDKIITIGRIVPRGEYVIGKGSVMYITKDGKLMPYDLKDVKEQSQYVLVSNKPVLVNTYPMTVDWDKIKKEKEKE